MKEQIDILAQAILCVLLFWVLWQMVQAAMGGLLRLMG